MWAQLKKMVSFKRIKYDALEVVFIIVEVEDENTMRNEGKWDLEWESLSLEWKVEKKMWGNDC